MTEDNRDNAGVRIFPPAVYIGALIVGYAIQWFWPLPIVPDSIALTARIAGGIIVLLGLGLMASAMREFRKAGTSVVPVEPTTALAFDGPYRFTRNPMYLGMALLLGGLALLGNALWPLIAVVPAVFVIQTQVIAREEAYLERKFGAEYVAFKSRVRRWL